MKKMIFYAVSITAISLTSCAKEYTCDCEVEHTQKANGFDYSEKFNVDTKIKSKEKSAESACTGLDYEESNTDTYQVKQTVKQKCKLK